MHCNTGKIFSKADLSPPTNIAMLPVAARWHPPLTGPSNGIAPLSVIFFPNLLTSFSSVVLISSQILFLEIPSKIPSFPSITSAQTLGEGRHVIIKSTFSANSFGVFEILAPFFLKDSTRLPSRSLTVTSKPFLSKLPASLPPTLPNPINPIFICVLI